MGENHAISSHNYPPRNVFLLLYLFNCNFMFTKRKKGRHTNYNILFLHLSSFLSSSCNMYVLDLTLCFIASLFLLSFFSSLSLTVSHSNSVLVRNDNVYALGGPISLLILMEIGRLG